MVVTKIYWHPMYSDYVFLFPDRGEYVYGWHEQFFIPLDLQTSSMLEYVGEM